MDLKLLKQVISLAKNNGLKSVKFEGLEITFNDQVVFPRRTRAKQALFPEQTIPAPPPDPTLDQINEYIYGKDHAQQ